MPRNVVTISLPDGLVKQMEAQRKVENRTRSELVREALRVYFRLMEGPTVLASPAELRALERGRKEALRGETVSLSDYLNDLDSRDRKVRQKKSRSTAAKRA